MFTDSMHVVKRATQVVALLVVLGVSGVSAIAQESDGATVYAANCAACHQASGTGIAGVFPPLVDHAASLALSDDGQRYLASVVLFGLQGAIEVDGGAYNGVMPGWSHLSDDEIAAVLTHVVFGLSDAPALDDLPPFSAELVAEARAEPRSPQEMYAQRPEPVALGADADSDEVEPIGPPVFTAAQVSRARATFSTQCAACHGDALNGGVVGGPPLRGGYFANRWSGRSVAELFEFTRARMPQDRPGSLSDQVYADLVAYILSHNGYAAGNSELPGSADALRRFVLNR